MDVEKDKFYDEISSFMPQPGDYSLDDLEEIIRSTDTHLDASLDIELFGNDFEHDEFVGHKEFLFKEQNELNKIKREEHHNFSFENEAPCYGENNKSSFNFSTLPSPSNSYQSVDYSSSCETPLYTSSMSSMDDNQFNPDDFINFLNDDAIKVEDISIDTMMELKEERRNTPSPTGSCTSSSGSSTSGVQSDASSVASMAQNLKCSTALEPDDDLLEFITFKNEKSKCAADQDESIVSQSLTSEDQFKNSSIFSSETTISKNEATPAIVPITIPILQVPTVQSISSVNLVQGAIIPVQTVPITNLNSVVNIKTPTAIKCDSNPALVKSEVTSPAKVLANTTPIAKTTSNVGSTTSSSPKIASPGNSKPKTIYLSSNDFKALMQKMNTNGKKHNGSNSQMPKIIMKTANGKIITANKLTCSSTNNLSLAATSSTVSTNSSTSNSSSQSLKFITTPSAVKQQPSKNLTSNTRTAAVMAAARASLGHSKTLRADLNTLKNITDEKLLKKQLRMLKNRESASLSRKKKKEYVERLENRISNLEKENYSLKGENSSLRSQLMAFAQTCNCKHSNVSEFILNTLNMSEDHGAASIFSSTNDNPYFINNSNSNHQRDNFSKTTNNSGSTRTTHHVKIAPKPPNAGPFINKGFRQRLTAATVKKNVAILFAMAFMVTLNVGNFQSYLKKTDVENAIETSVSASNEEPMPHNGRRLLWVPNEHEFHQQANRSKREAEMTNMPPPPLHFLRPVNRTTADKLNGTSTKDEPPLKRPVLKDTTTTTTTYMNATQENMRLVKNLHKWIGGNGYLNSTAAQTGNNFEHTTRFRFGSGLYMDYDLPLQAPIGTKQKRKIYLDSETSEKQSKLNIDDHNSLDIYKPRISEEYLKLFKGIKRQDDTFYVLSFNMDHILLPASNYNKSSRPKMSLMLPAGDPSLNGDVVLMQIDCEVINTTELEIKSHMIPEKLRPSKYSSNVHVNPNDVANNETSGTTSKTTQNSKNVPDIREERKEKPSAPRTYFMMGPKNRDSLHASNSNSNGANIVKRKPGIIKLNANDSVIGSGILNVRNSTLFSRMRETVGSHNNGFITTSDVKKLI